MYVRTWVISSPSYTTYFKLVLKSCSNFIQPTEKALFICVHQFAVHHSSFCLSVTSLCCAVQTQEDKVSLRAGQCHEVELKIEKPGVLLEWEFRTEPKGIAFGIFYRRKEGSSQSEVSGGGGGGCSVWLGDEVQVISLCAYVQWVACYRHTHMYSALRLPLSLCTILGAPFETLHIPQDHAHREDCHTEARHVHPQL